MPAAMKQSILHGPLQMRSAKNSHSSSQSLDPEQDANLETALAKVQQLSIRMTRFLDAGKLMEAIQSCSSLLNELRTSHLSPKMYYTLYIAVSDTLGYLSLYLSDNFLKSQEGAQQNAMRLIDLYELVQYAGNIVPRLYLLLTVGAVWIQSPLMPWTLALADRGYSAEDYATCKSALLKDMLEMARGVQHPIRGLFLRHYLSSLVKDQLPDIQLDAPLSDSGAFQDSVDFILTNFAEMNKLWVRLSFLGSSKDRERREAERMELRILIGTNLVRLSQLEGVDLVFYKNVVLPALLSEIIGCGDRLAQEYLMEVLIQVFSNEYHLHTLSTLLEATIQLEPSVNVSALYQDLMHRLCEFVQSQPLREFDASELASMSDKEKEERVGERTIPGHVNLFQVFFAELDALVQNRVTFSLEETLQLAFSLQQLSLTIYPNCQSNIESLFRFIYARLSALSVTCMDAEQGSAGGYLVKMISLAIDTKKHMLNMLCFDVTPALAARFLNLESRKAIAFQIIRCFLETEAPLLHCGSATIEKLLLWMSPLIDAQEVMPYCASYGASPTGTGTSLATRSSRESSAAASPIHAAKSATEEPLDVVDWSLAQLEELSHAQGQLCRFLSLCQPYALCTRADTAEEVFGEAESYLSLLDRLAEKLKRGGSLRFRFTSQTVFYLARAAFLSLASRGSGAAERGQSLLGKYIAWMLRLLTALAYSDHHDKEVLCLMEQLGHALPTFTFSCSFGQREGKESKGLKAWAASSSWSLYSSFASREALGIVDYERLQPMSMGHFNLSACFSRSYPFELAFRLALDLSLLATPFASLSDQVYEALAESLIWYEEGIVDSRAQVAALCEFVSTLARIQNLSLDAMHVFIAKALAYSGQLLRRQESARLVSLCAYLYYPVEQRSGYARSDERACHCLSKATWMARSISDAAVKAIALLDLMDVARVLDENGCDGMQPIVQDLAALIESALGQVSAHACFPDNVTWLMERAKSQRFKLRQYELSAMEQLVAGRSRGMATDAKHDGPPVIETETEAEADAENVATALHTTNDAHSGHSRVPVGSDGSSLQPDAKSPPPPLAMELPPEFRDTHHQWQKSDESLSSSRSSS